ncbi:ankyrin repeat domain-containing protein [Streptomyces sp. NPDC023838]|uniref:ankyrin repeat domain-containing protein n=1 Tax=Streptomyces sp. NPDC023838 TaxID=3154325 RepID=UPI003401CD0F
MSTLLIDAHEPLAVEATAAIRSGDLPALRGLLAAHPGLAAARLGDELVNRTLLHVATDWPGHFPNGPAIVTALVEAGADVGARFTGPHTETALHWAASCDDVDVLDALLDLGADIEVDGSVIAGGTAIADAVAFGQWGAARRLLERGARTTLWQAAGLGELDRVAAYFAPGATPPPAIEITEALWCACHGGQQPTAAYLRERGGDINWVGYDELTPLDAAARAGHGEVVAWLRKLGARSAKERA